MSKPEKEVVSMEAESEYDPFDDDLFDDEDETRTCGEMCSHYDNINQCCWVATKKGLCQDVRDGDLCLFGFKEDDNR